MGSSRARRPSTGGRAGAYGNRSGATGGTASYGESAKGSRYLPRFFIDSSQLAASPCSKSVLAADAVGHELRLDADDSRHALNVLRLQPGDQCEIVLTPDVSGEKGDSLPAGVGYVATVTVAADEVWVVPSAPLVGRQKGARYATEVGIVQAITRPAAMDYLVEKGTEVGANFFLLVPVPGSPSHVQSTQAARLVRWRRIAREAAKQSKQLAIPSVEVSASLEEALDRLRPDARLLVLQPDASEGLYEALSKPSGWVETTRGDDAARRSRLALWVGTESGWTEEQLAGLAAAGAKAVRLGQGVLRAETAGPVAVAVARLALGDW